MYMTKDLIRDRLRSVGEWARQTQCVVQVSGRHLFIPGATACALEHSAVQESSVLPSWTHKDTSVKSHQNHSLDLKNACGHWRARMPGRHSPSTCRGHQKSRLKQDATPHTLDQVACVAIGPRPLTWTNPDLTLPILHNSRMVRVPDSLFIWTLFPFIS